MRDYIVCLRAILSKFDRPWTEERQLELPYDNMLPLLQFKIRQEVTSINQNPKSCIMPEVAYQSPTTPAKPLLPRKKSSLVAIAESANPHNKRFEADDIAQKTSLAAVVAHSPADLNKLISKVLEEKLAQFGIKPNNQPNSTKPSGASEHKGVYRKTIRNTQGVEGLPS